MFVTAVRALILFSIVLVAVRLMGKRELGQLQPYEFVIALMIANLASVPMAEMGIPYAGWNGDWFYAFLGAALIIAVLANQVVARRATRSRTRADGVPARTTDAKAGVDR